MSKLVNLYCLNRNTYLLVTKENEKQNLDCFFIIADIEEKKIYCYTKRELEQLHSVHKFEIEGITFHASYPDRLVRWTNKVVNKVLDIEKDYKMPPTTINGEVVYHKDQVYQRFVIKDNDYIVVRLIPSVITFKTKPLNISPMAVHSIKAANDSYLPALAVRKIKQIDTVSLRQEIMRYNNIATISCKDLKLQEIDFKDIEISGVVSLSLAFAQMENVQKIHMGKFDLNRLYSVHGMLSSSHRIEVLDFSQSKGDLDSRLNINNAYTIKQFELLGFSIPYQPLIVYLNKDSLNFNKLLIKANPDIRIITGLVPSSNKEERAKILIAKDRLLKGTPNNIRGYFVRVDNDE